MAAENIAIRQPLITMQRTRKRLCKIAVVLKPATILKFHKLFVERKYKKLFPNNTKNKPGRKGPSQEIIERHQFNQISTSVYILLAVQHAINA